MPVGITLSTDMEWNKIISDNSYNSLSEYTLIIGCISKNIIAGVISNRIYRLCSTPEQIVHSRPQKCTPNIIRACQKLWR